MLISSCNFYSSSDRVFSAECSTRQVYEEGARQVALSVLNGINCTYTGNKQKYIYIQNSVIVCLI